MLKILKSQLFIFLVIISIVLLIFFHFFTQWNDAHTSNYLEINALFMVVLTAILILVAYTQLSSLNKTAKADF